MRKLIIAAAIVCAAAMSQAAAFTWKAANVKDINKSATYSGSATLYVINAASETQTYAGEMSAGKINMVVGDNSAADAGFIKQGQLYTVYYKMTDSEGNVFTSTTKSGVEATYQAAATINFLGGGSWVAAPEPTSAMLLLLGMAGLALKRKRA